MKTIRQFAEEICPRPRWIPQMRIPDEGPTPPSDSARCAWVNEVTRVENILKQLETQIRSENKD